MFSLTGNSDEMIDLKVEEISARFKWLALLAGGIGAIPVPGLSAVLDLGILVAETVFQKKQLGIDDESIKKKAEIVGSDKKNILKYVRDELAKVNEKQELIDRICKVMATSLPGQALQAATLTTLYISVSEAAEAAFKYSIPIVGMVVSAGISACTTYVFLKQIVQAHATIAKMCLQVCGKVVKEMET